MSMTQCWPKQSIWSTRIRTHGPYPGRQSALALPALPHCSNQTSANTFAGEWRGCIRERVWQSLIRQCVLQVRQMMTTWVELIPQLSAKRYLLSIIGSSHQDTFMTTLYSTSRTHTQASTSRNCYVLVLDVLLLPRGEAKDRRSF
jgi:hypothetical protein